MSMQRRTGRIVVLKNSQELTSDAIMIIERLGRKPLTERRNEHVKELVNKCLQGLVPDLFKSYFNTRRCDIRAHYTRKSMNIFFLIKLTVRDH